MYLQHPVIVPLRTKSSATFLTPQTSPGTSAPSPPDQNAHTHSGWRDPTSPEKTPHPLQRIGAVNPQSAVADPAESQRLRRTVPDPATESDH